MTSLVFFLSKTEHRERSKFKSERNDLESSYVPVSAPPANSSEQYSSGAQSIPSTVTVIAPAHHSENTTESWSNYYNNHSSSNSFGRNPPPKRRCRDYDGKDCLLFCMCCSQLGKQVLQIRHGCSSAICLYLCEYWCFLRTPCNVFSLTVSWK